MSLELRPLPQDAIAKDPFAPVLTASEPLNISAEQELAIRNLLLLTSSDTDFAQKAATALRIILSGGVNGGVVPVLVSLEPTTGVVNAVNFKLKCKGTDFIAGATVYLNGNPQPTTFVNATEVTVTLTLPATPQSINVLVRNPTGAISNSRTFTVTASVVADESVAPSSFTEPPANPFNFISNAE